MTSSGNVLITGCSTGIGNATALHLDRLGYRVFASIRNESDAQALRAQSSDRLTPIFMDVTDGESILQAKEAITGSVGVQGLSGIVNNAGVGFTSPLECIDLDSARWLFEVNVFGLLAVTQAFLPLVRQACGRIINISSISSIIVAPFHGTYSASKLAVNGLSDALRRELRQFGIQVSVIIAGSIATPMWQKGSELSTQALGSRYEEAATYYGKQYSKMGDFFKQTGQRGIAVEHVACVIAAALSAKKAKHYYWVGKDALFYRFSKASTPEAWSDWIVMHFLGLENK